VAAALTALAVAVHGYHPFAEDGGLYLAGIKWLLCPRLFPYWTPFVTAHLRFSLFAPMVAILVHGLSMSLMTVMLLLYVASFWVTLFAGWQLAARCYRDFEARSGAVALLALWLTIPVAGTSLMLMDPYVSARSISTPCSLLAIVGMLDMRCDLRRNGSVQWRSVALCGGALLIAGIVHPLMAAYALGCVLLLAADGLVHGNVRIRVTLGLCAAAVLSAACLHWLDAGQTADYAEVARTRTYWFIDQWHWYEQFGLVAPLLILATIGFKRGEAKDSTAASLARVAVIAGITGIIVVLLFARTASSTYVVARLQPLRIFQTIYVLMILAAGAMLGRWILRRSLWRWTIMFGLLGTVMLFAQKNTFPYSAHLELPWVTPSNGWELAFVWIREHTPENAVFALDAHYVTEAGEDAQNFRAIAERSALPDYSKDGGVAAITPSLAEAWTKAQAEQTGLNQSTDKQRIERLRSTLVEWVVLPRNVMTDFKCSYANGDVQVCRLPSK
jgi:hypothetical protein